MENEARLTVQERDCLEQCRKMDAECRRMWIRAMEYSPRLARYCSHWHDFTPMDWAELAAHNKDFINIAPLHEFSGAEWYIVLNRQPLLIEHCPVIDDLPPNYWDALLKEYPWFETYRKKQKNTCELTVPGVSQLIEVCHGVSQWRSSGVSQFACLLL